MKDKVKWIRGGICLSLLLMIILIFLFRVTILMRAGQFMAPEGKYFADVAILEANKFVDRHCMMDMMNLLSSGNVKRLIVVLHRITPSQKPLGFNEEYRNQAKKEMEAFRLKERDFKIIVIPVHHPVTLIEARGVVEAISKEGVKSAILISSGFHARRSYLVYRHVCSPFQIKIFPCACFNKYQLDHWWSQERALRDFVTELLKLTYYLARGYIPFKLSC